MAKLVVEGLEFFAYHGCHPLERKTGGSFKVDLCIEGSFREAYESDNIKSAIDYVHLMDIAEKQMSKRCNLIETVAKNIASAIAEAYPMAERIEATVYKLKVPLKHRLEYVSVNHVINKTVDN